MPFIASSIARAAVSALCLIAAAAIAAAPARAGETCVPPGQWSAPGGARLAAPEILARAAKAKVVLLGESHDDPDHHRWELQTVAALAALHPKMALGFEMFPRRVQGALDRWVAGELSEHEFLQAADWSRVWTYGASYYLPLFHFARMNRIPMLALNVERDLVRAVGAKGLAATPVEQREGVSAPAPASASYIGRLFEVYTRHPDTKEPPRARTDPEFGRFVEAQLMWDRAMAQALAGASLRDPEVLAVGIMGSRHIAHGEGVAHQIRSLGVTSIVSLLPWDAGDDCADFSAGFATAVFGLPAAKADAAAPPPQRLGIQIRTVADGVLIVAVDTGSIADTSGMRVDDVLVEVAGTPVRTTDDVRALVGRTAPGTWLPLRLKRKAELVDLTAKFPAKK